jgi:hypothetical protein
MIFSENRFPLFGIMLELRFGNRPRTFGLFATRRACYEGAHVTAAHNQIRGSVGDPHYRPGFRLSA